MYSAKNMSSINFGKANSGTIKANKLQKFDSYGSSN